MSAGRPRRLTGRYVLAIIVAFFALIIAVNVVFAWFAIDTHPGVDDADAYRRGLAYNETLDRAARQQALGWRVSIDLVDAGTLVVMAADSAGKPLAGLTAAARLRRPARSDSDRAIDLPELAPGRYAAMVPGIGEGQWDVEATLSTSGGETYRLEKRLWVERK